jgi:hypothetical protein
MYVKAVESAYASPIFNTVFTSSLSTADSTGRQGVARILVLSEDLAFCNVVTAIGSSCEFLVGR